MSGCVSESMGECVSTIYMCVCVDGVKYMYVCMRRACAVCIYYSKYFAAFFSIVLCYITTAPTRATHTHTHTHALIPAGQGSSNCHSRWYPSCSSTCRSLHVSVFICGVCVFVYMYIRDITYACISISDTL
jgi:hypothetical protein